MILVVLGTQDKPFTRAIQIVEQAVKDQIIQDEVIVQAGNTSYASEYLSIFDFLTMDEFDSFMEQADLVITHGGVGSILGALKLQKPMIAIPRLAKLGEHGNDHQLEIVEEFAKNGYLIPLYENDDFAAVYEQARGFHPKPYKSTTKQVIDCIQTFIDTGKIK